MPNAARWRRIVRRRKASSLLNRHRQGEKVDPAQLAAAARFMVLTANRNLGKKGRSKRGKKGGHKSWEGTTEKERSIEMRRRAAVRRRNQLARLHSVAG